MNVVYKYPIVLEEGECFDLKLPLGAIILDVQLQNGSPVLWALHDVSDSEEVRHIYAVWTGKPFAIIDDTRVLHIKTLIDSHGLVWHIFESVL